jgi:transposase
VKVAHQSVSQESRSALVWLEPDERYRPLCHACGQPARTVHSHTRKFVRDLPFGDSSMMLQVEHRKVWCDHCGGVRVEKLEFVDAGQRITHRLGAYAVQLCRRGLSVTAVADHLDLDPKTVKTLDHAALEVEFGKTDYAGLRRLAIDEIAVKKGHNYMTVVLDYDTGRVVWMGRGRQTATLDEFFRKMPPTVRICIQAVAIDMWEPYIQCVRRWCKNADIVFDLFHVVKAFNEVIDKIRNEEFRKATEDERDILKGSKYLFLMLWGNLRRDQRVRLNQILEINQRLNIVYWLKDFLAHIWEYHIPGWAEGALAEWCAVAREDGHPSLVRFAAKLERHQYGIISHCQHRMHTSLLEGVNNKIKVIKRVAYGFHDLDYFALKVKQAFPGRESSN